MEVLDIVRDFSGWKQDYIRKVQTDNFGWKNVQAIQLMIYKDILNTTSRDFSFLIPTVKGAQSKV